MNGVELSRPERIAKQLRAYAARLDHLSGEKLQRRFFDALQTARTLCSEGRLAVTSDEAVEGAGALEALSTAQALRGVSDSLPLLALSYGAEADPARRRAMVATAAYRLREAAHLIDGGLQDAGADGEVSA